MNWQISGINDHSFAWGLSEGGTDHLAKILAALRRLAGEPALALTGSERRLLEALNAKQVHWEIRHDDGAIRWCFEPWRETPRLEGEGTSLAHALAQMGAAAHRYYGIEETPDTPPHRAAS